MCLCEGLVTNIGSLSGAAQINYLDWEHISIQSRRCYEIARIYGKPIIVMEPVKGGGLAVIPKEAEDLMREVRPDDSPASWALRFAAGLDGVIMVLSGMNTIDQMRDNIRTFDNLTPLSEREHAILQEAARIISRSICGTRTACRYCIDLCTQNIPIAVLSSYSVISNEMEDSAISLAEVKRISRRLETIRHVCY